MNLHQVLACLSFLFLQVVDLQSEQSMVLLGKAYCRDGVDKRVEVTLKLPAHEVATAYDQVGTLASRFEPVYELCYPLSLHAFICQANMSIIVVNLGIYALTIKFLLQQLCPTLVCQISLICTPHRHHMGLLLSTRRTATGYECQ